MQRRSGATTVLDDPSAGGAAGFQHVLSRWLASLQWYPRRVRELLVILAT